MSGSNHWDVPVDMHTRVCAWSPSLRVSAILRTLSFVIFFCFYSRMVLSASSVGTIIFNNFHQCELYKLATLHVFSGDMKFSSM